MTFHSLGVHLQRKLMTDSWQVVLMVVSVPDGQTGGGGDSVTVAPFWAFLPRSSELLYETVALWRQRSVCSHHVCDLKH